MYTWDAKHTTLYCYIKQCESVYIGRSPLQAHVSPNISPSTLLASSDIYCYIKHPRCCRRLSVRRCTRD